MRRILVPDLPGARIRLQRVPHRVLEPAHRVAVGVLPAGFILGLVEVIEVMAEGMVQDPGLARDARLQGIHLLEQPIEPGRLEGRYVLVVMVEGADAAFGEYADQRPGNQRHDVVNERVHQDIAAENQGKEEHRKSVLPISKDAHEHLADERLNQTGPAARTAAPPRPYQHLGGGGPVPGRESRQRMAAPGRVAARAMPAAPPACHDRAMPRVSGLPVHHVGAAGAKSPCGRRWPGGG